MAAARAAAAGAMLHPRPPPLARPHSAGLTVPLGPRAQGSLEELLSHAHAREATWRERCTEPPIEQGGEQRDEQRGEQGAVQVPAVQVDRSLQVDPSDVLLSLLACSAESRARTSRSRAPLAGAGAHAAEHPVPPPPVPDGRRARAVPPALVQTHRAGGDGGYGGYGGDGGDGGDGRIEGLLGSARRGAIGRSTRADRGERGGNVNVPVSKLPRYAQPSRGSCRPPRFERSYEAATRSWAAHTTFGTATFGTSMAATSI